jgi:ABC-type amino acid transport system permease subunit
MHTILRSRMARFQFWWRAPVTFKDRALGGIVGAIAGFWLGLLSFSAMLPSSLQPVQFVCIVIGTCALAGILFPKVATLVLFPFGVFGGSI